ncbi:MAG: patatin-like phospholipase family protein, partial [Pseudoxanthomonas sp.]
MRRERAVSTHSTITPWPHCLVLLLGLALTGVVSAAEPEPPTEQQGRSCGTRSAGDGRPRIGLALGGGGARGIAHVRILKKLEQLHIPVDCIAGTSAGALVGALYASGRSADEIEQVVLSVDWKQQFSDSLPRKDRSLRRKSDDYVQLAPIGVGLHRAGRGARLAAGLSEGEKLMQLFERETGSGRVNGSFDDLPIPFRAVATDINTGQAVVLSEGNLALAMRASMSLPGIFRPVEIDGRILLDGGLANQVPIDVVRAMGADRIIAVDVGTPLSVLGRDASVVEVLGQLTGFLTTSNAARQISSLGPQDVVIAPKLEGKVATGEFGKAQLALDIGQEAADSQSDQLAALSTDASRYQAFEARHERQTLPAPVIEFVEIDNQTGYDDALLLAYLPIKIGEPLDTDAMQAGALQGYGLDTLSKFSYSTVRDGQGRTGVRVEAQEKPHGPVYVQAGMTLSNDLRGDNDANLRAGLLFSPISPYGAEARVVLQVGSEPALTGEYYRPFDLAGDYAFNILGGYETGNFNVFDGSGEKISRYRVHRYGLTASLLRNVSNTATFGLSLDRYAGSANQDIGDPAGPDIDFQEGALVAHATFDSIDSVYVPRDGYFIRAGYRSSQDWAGADTEFDQLDFDGFAARSFGRHSVQAGARYHVTTSGIAPIQSIYRLGGRWRLAGFQRNELTGQNYALVFTSYTFELGKFLGRS